MPLSHSPQLVWLALTAVALFMAFIGLRVHYVWIDEVAYAEAAINYVKDGSYTSVAFFTSRADETHVSPTPAHSFLLIGWLKLFGVSQTAVRSLPLLLAVVATIVFWRACLRTGLIHSAAAGTILVSVALLSYGFSFSYTTARPDAVAVVVLSTMFYLAVRPPSALVLGTFTALAVALPFVQSAAVIYAFILSAVLLVFVRGPALRPVLLACAGMIAGLLLQVVMYKMAGVWEAWVALLRSERSVGLAQYLLERLSLRGLLNHSNTLPKDFSAFVLLGGIAALGLAAWRLRFSVSQRFGVSVFQLPATSQPPPVTTSPPPSDPPRHAGLSRRKETKAEAAQCEGGSLVTGHSSPVTRYSAPWLARLALTIFVAVLLGMYALGKFPTYYGWMLTFPLAAILAAMFDRLPPEPRALRTAAVAIAILSCLVGFPVQAAVALNDWPYRTPDRVNEWLQARIQPDDIVYCDYPFYYLAKEKAHKVFVGRYSRMMTLEDLDSLDLVLLSKTFSDWSHPEILQNRATNREDWAPTRAGLLGNDWRYGILSAPNYSCVAFRLAPPARTPSFQ